MIYYNSRNGWVLSSIHFFVIVHSRSEVCRVTCTLVPEACRREFFTLWVFGRIRGGIKVQLVGRGPLTGQ